MTTTPTDQSESAPNIDLQVRADQLKLLFQQSFPALFVSLFIVLLLSWMLRRDVDVAILWWWLGLLGVSTLVRLLLFLVYFKRQPTGAALLRWERPYLVTLLLSSSIWGVGALVLMREVPLLDQALICFALVGLAGGGLATYSAYRVATIIATVSVLLPSTLWLFMQGEEIRLCMAIGAGVFVISTLRASSVTSSALYRSFQLTRELEHANDVTDRLARTDELTGLNNRRAFFERGEQIVSYCQRNQRPLCMLLMDVDHFKGINDSHGHAVGDAALQFVGKILGQRFRKADVCGRIGGEEFAMLLPDTGPGDARLIAEALRQAIAETPIAIADKTLSITVSIGLAEGCYDLDVLLKQADVAMYRAKAEGRNRVICVETGA